MMKIIINAIIAKIISGGGFQIAKNFILESKKSDRYNIEWYYILSSDLDSEIGYEFNNLRDLKYFVFPTQPDFKNSYLKVRKQLQTLEEQIKPDLIYSVLSPSYFKFKAPEVVRFANAWVTNPNSYAKKAIIGTKKLQMWLYCINQRRLMRKCNYFITQSECVKKGIERITNVTPNNIAVVANVLPALFSKYPKREPSYISNASTIHVACIAAPVPHKNLDIAPSLIICLKEKYDLRNIVFHLTIPFEHPLWKSMSTELGKNGLLNNVCNHGYSTQQQLTEIYTQCQIAFVPTLLETFSASLIEAMHFGLYIVASDFEFNREVTEDAALYFVPTNEESAASKIDQILKSKRTQEVLKSNINNRLSLFSNYEKHFDDIVNFLSQVIEHKL